MTALLEILSLDGRQSAHIVHDAMIIWVAVGDWQIQRLAKSSSKTTHGDLHEALSVAPPAPLRPSIAEAECANTIALR